MLRKSSRAELARQALMARVVDGFLPFGAVSDVAREIGLSKGGVSLQKSYLGLEFPPLQHGRALYEKGCHCDRCLTDTREYQREYRSRRKAAAS